MARIRTVRGLVEKRRRHVIGWRANRSSFAVLESTPSRERDPYERIDVDEVATAVLSDVIASVNQSVAQF